MPHDRYGKELKVGDSVLVPCNVVSVSPGEEACNVTVEPSLMPEGVSYKPTIVLNSKQIEKVEPPKTE